MKGFMIVAGVALFGISSVIGYRLPKRQAPVRPVTPVRTAVTPTAPPTPAALPVPPPTRHPVSPPRSTVRTPTSVETDDTPVEALEAYPDDPAPDRGWVIPVTRYHQLLRVDLADEKLYYYEAGACRLMAPCSSASTAKVLPVGTKTDEPHDHVGVFSIDRKEKDGWSRSYQVPMPHYMHYIEGHGIHAAIEEEFGEIGSPASHGCVRLMPDVAAWLFKRVKIGCKVEFRR